MTRKFVAAAIGAVLAVSVFGASGASAATEFGDSCVANRGSSETQITIFGVASPSPLPLAAPSAGVITSWRLTLITPPPPDPAIPAIIPQTLKVLRLNTGAKTAQVIGESSGTIGSGLNTVPARIPIQAGDRLALFGSGAIFFEGSTQEVGTLFCEEEGGASYVYGGFPGSVPVGASTTYAEASGPIRVPAVAVIEPDADNDGFGDETQDGCPQSATTSAACPPVVLSTSKQVRKGSVTVIVTTSTPAPVTVKGIAKLGKGKKAKLNGGTQNLTPGVLGKFTLKFNKALKAKLKALSTKQKLTLNVTVSGTGVSGAVTTKTLKVKLKGQAKPKS